MRSFELFVTIYKNVKFDWDRLPFWWPGSDFEILISTILTQNTKWSGVEKSLENLAKFGINSLERLNEISTDELANLIKPSGFYNTKSKRILSFSRSIVLKFGSLLNFKNEVSKEWLLFQKGIGFESAYSILCYLCKREFMVVDSYTMRIFEFLNYEFESYEEASAWLGDIDCVEVNKTLGLNLTQNELYARYHGAIVEFCKINFKGKNISQKGQEILSQLI